MTAAGQTAERRRVLRHAGQSAFQNVSLALLPVRDSVWLRSRVFDSSVCLRGLAFAHAAHPLPWQTPSTAPRSGPSWGCLTTPISALPSSASCPASPCAGTHQCLPPPTWASKALGRKQCSLGSHSARVSGRWLEVGPDVPMVPCSTPSPHLEAAVVGRGPTRPDQQPGPGN